MTHDDPPALPEFDRRPPVTDKAVQYRIYRVGTGAGLRIVCLSPDLLGIHTHWIGGGTRPCLSGGVCLPCQHGVRRDWHAWVTGYDPTNGHIRIVELTENAAGPPARWIDSTGTLRGARLTLRRPGGRKTSPLVSEVEAGSVPAELLPPDADRVRCLLRLWRLPDTHLAAISTSDLSGISLKLREA